MERGEGAEDERGSGGGFDGRRSFVWGVGAGGDYARMTGLR